MVDTVLYIPERVLGEAELDEVPCYAITAQGITHAPLAEQLAALAGTAVKLVLSVANVTLTEVALTRKQARHMDSVLPYLLEENLLEPAETLWFSYQRAAKGTQHYPVAVCGREALAALYNHFQAAGCHLTAVHVDALLIDHMAPAVVHHHSSVLLLHSNTQAIQVPEAQLYAVANALGMELDALPTHELDETLLQHMADNTAGAMNLLHGELPPMNRSAQQRWWTEWQPLVSFAAVVLLVMLGLVFVQTQRYNKAAQTAHQEAVALYQSLFPQAARPQLLQREFENQLRRLQHSGHEESAFISLMSPVAQALSQQQFDKLTPLRFQFNERESRLSFDLTAPEFSHIENLRETLQAQGMAVDVGNSRNASDGVTARLTVGRAST